MKHLIVALTFLQSKDGCFCDSYSLPIKTKSAMNIKGDHDDTLDIDRRRAIQGIFGAISLSPLQILIGSQISPNPVSAQEEPFNAHPDDSDSSNLKNYVYSNEWRGTSLPLLSPLEAASMARSSYEMGRWPDPILRRPASLVPLSLMKKGVAGVDVNSGHHDYCVKSIAEKLRRTARENEAVGLAAQQW